MSFLYQGRCFETKLDALEYLAASCPPVSGQLKIECATNITEVQITSTDLIAPFTANTTSVNIPEITCDPSLTDLIEVSWMAAGLLISAFLIRLLIRQLNKG